MTVRQQPISLQTWNALTAEQQRETLAAVPVTTRLRFNRQSNGSVGWAGWSWNPVTGCLHQCAYCYARAMAHRFYGSFAPMLHPERLAIPCSQRPPAGASLVFTVSMGDLFGDWVPQAWIDAVLAAIRDAPQWTFLLLTKNPPRLVGQSFPPNAWVGATVDTQARADAIANVLPQVAASVRWLSCEPMLEPLHFAPAKLALVDWIVIGSQTRTARAAARQPDSAWVAALTEQARAAGAAVYHKDNLRLPDDVERVREYPNRSQHDVLL
jgi:protein gp37